MPRTLVTAVTALPARSWMAPIFWVISTVARLLGSERLDPAGHQREWPTMSEIQLRRRNIRNYLAAPTIILGIGDGP